MPKNNEISSQALFTQCFDLPNPGLRSYFDNVVKGQSDEYRTTFAKGSSMHKVLADWELHLNSIANEWPTLIDFENDLRAKVGPMSIMKPLAERMEDIDNYYTLINKPAIEVNPSAIKAVCSEFKVLKGLHLRSEQRTVDIMKKSTNSGAPYFRKRKGVVSKTLPCAVKQSGIHTWQWLNINSNTEKEESLLYFINRPFHETCAILGWRGQEGGPKPSDVKQRVVWMFPFSVNIKELQFYQPMIESAQRFNLVPAWVSMESVDNSITRMFDTKGDDDLVICTDFSKFDQHFNESCQNCAREIISSILDNSAASDEWLSNVFPIKYAIPLAYDYGKIRVGKHGMGSGSGGTNADETLTHRALQYEAAINNNSRLNPNSQCLGDDGVLTYPGITVEDVVRSYSAHGLDMNPDKQYVSKQDCVYLRRWHHINYRVDGVCVGVYSTYRALGRLMEQERYYNPEVWGPKMVALRQLSIIENCKWHPMFNQFVEFCMKRDKYRLGIDIPGFLDNIDSVAREANDYMPDFLGYTKSMNKDADKGLADWAVVKLLKSKA